MKAYPISTQNLKLKLYLQNLLDNIRTIFLTLDFVTKFRYWETKVWSNTSIWPCNLPAFLDHQQQHLNKSETVCSGLPAKPEDDTFVEANTKKQDLVDSQIHKSCISGQTLNPWTSLLEPQQIKPTSQTLQIISNNCTTCTWTLHILKYKWTQFRLCSTPSFGLILALSVCPQYGKNSFRKRTMTHSQTW